jgi:hypothetical protein
VVVTVRGCAELKLSREIPSITSSPAIVASALVVPATVITPLVTCVLSGPLSPLRILWGTFTRWRCSLIVCIALRLPMLGCSLLARLALLLDWGRR